MDSCGQSNLLTTAQRHIRNTSFFLEQEICTVQLLTLILDTVSQLLYPL